MFEIDSFFYSSTENTSSVGEKLVERAKKLNRKTTWLNSKEYSVLNKNQDHVLNYDNIKHKSTEKVFEIIKDLLVEKDNQIKELQEHIDLLKDIVIKNNQKTYI